MVCSYLGYISGGFFVKVSCAMALIIFAQKKARQLSSVPYDHTSTDLRLLAPS